MPNSFACRCWAFRSTLRKPGEELPAQNPIYSLYFGRLLEGPNLIFSYTFLPVEPKLGKASEIIPSPPRTPSVPHVLGSVQKGLNFGFFHSFCPLTPIYAMSHKLSLAYRAGTSHRRHPPFPGVAVPNTL